VIVRREFLVVVCARDPLTDMPFLAWSSRHRVAAPWEGARVRPTACRRIEREWRRRWRSPRGKVLADALALCGGTVLVASRPLNARCASDAGARELVAELCEVRVSQALAYSPAALVRVVVGAGDDRWFW